MKKLNMTFLLTVLLSMIGANGFAHDIEVANVDGVTIYYNWTNNNTKLAVSYRGNSYSSYSNEYTGNVVIPESVTYNGKTYSVTSIGNDAFRSCSGLTSITIPNSVKSIEKSAFYHCSGLTNLIIGEGVTSIGGFAFGYCSSLTSLTLPNSVTSISNDVFRDCSTLKSLTLSNKLTIIAAYAFQGCSSLTSVTIPNGVSSIGAYAFSGCSSLVNVIIPTSVTNIYPYAFEKCRSLTSLMIPNSVVSIGNGTFSYCGSLGSVSIPNSVTDIGDMVFYRCYELASVTIPNSIVYIPERMLGDCYNLKNVYCYIEKVPPTSSLAFENAEINKAVLYVPDVSINDYRASVPWNQFGTIVGMNGGQGNEPKKCSKPKIYYSNGKLSFESDTEDVIFQSSIMNSDIRQYSSNEIQLGVTYSISVYATKLGYENSDVATATLCWIDVEPKTEGITDGTTGAKQIEANAVLIQTESGQISVSGANDGTAISVFGTNGLQVGSAVSRNGQAVINTHLPSGSVAIVRIGNRSVKVVVK